MYENNNAPLKTILFQYAPEANEKEDVKVLSTKSLMDIFCPTFCSDVTQKHACGMTLKCGF